MSKVTLYRRMKKNNPDLFPNIQTALERVDDINEGELSSVDNEIRLLTALLMETLTKTEGEEWSQGHTESAVSLIKELGKMKDIKSKIEKEKSVSPKALDMLVKQIFEIIRKSVDEGSAKKILTGIMREVIIPMKPNKDGGEVVYMSDIEESKNE